jgi:hypothetical protein
MQRRLSLLAVRLVVTLSVALVLSAAAWSQCNNPTSAGVVICTPTNNATVAYVPEVSVRSTPAQGATMTGLLIYDNYAQIYTGPPYGVDLIDGSIYNGSHYVVANAWDSDGNFYQAATSFFVTGLGYAPCPQPNTPGVVICSPPKGTFYPTNVLVNAAARGRSNITSMSWFLNGKLVQTVNHTYVAGVSVQLGSEGIDNVVKVAAKDASGDTYSAAVVVNATYTYGAGGCYQTCTPGIQITQPAAYAYVAGTFNINAQIVNYPVHITTMLAYLDNDLVAQSSNASLQAEVSGAPSGTHILTIQGWDDDGVEYRLQEDININVNE